MVLSNIPPHTELIQLDRITKNLCLTKLPPRLHFSSSIVPSVKSRYAGLFVISALNTLARNMKTILALLLFGATALLVHSEEFPAEHAEFMDFLEDH